MIEEVNVCWKMLLSPKETLNLANYEVINKKNFIPFIKEFPEKIATY